jgi:hypothetical protein
MHADETRVFVSTADVMRHLARCAAQISHFLPSTLHRFNFNCQLHLTSMLMSACICDVGIFGRAPGSPTGSTHWNQVAGSETLLNPRRAASTRRYKIKCS